MYKRQVVVIGFDYCSASPNSPSYRSGHHLGPTSHTRHAVTHTLLVDTDAARDGRWGWPAPRSGISQGASWCYTRGGRWEVTRPQDRRTARGLHQCVSAPLFLQLRAATRKRPSGGKPAALLLQVASHRRLRVKTLRQRSKARSEEPQ